VIRILVLFVLVGCPSMKVTQLPLGTRVPVEQLHAQRADVPGFIQRELDARHDARAFYALELDKTRPYAQEALAARDRSGPKRAIVDLRPVFAALVDPQKPTVVAQAEVPDQARGLVLVQTTTAAQQHAQATDAAFWAHMRRFEKRTEPLNAKTIGIPYDYAAREAYGVSTAEETGRLFGSGEAFLSYFVHGDAVTVFVLVGGVLHVERLGVRARDLRDQVQKFVTLVRTPPRAGSPDWMIDAKRLHAILLAPLEPVFAGKVSSLFISPHGFLANLPFGLLTDAAGKIALEARRVTYVPSASVYRHLLARPILNQPPRMLAIGNAIYPEGVVPLEFAEKEATTVSEMFPGGKLLRGNAATEAKVRELAPSYNILHFATHGVLLGSVVPGGSSLLVTADGNHDGFLSAIEIAGQDLSRSYIAVLSACETSVSAENGQSIDLGSITNAFLTAGAPSVLGTMWQVNDAATTTLMLDFYQQFLEVGAGEALRRAQLALRADRRYAHPYYWGAFVLFGWDK
jgi:CHAT domain-containing protein